MCWKSLFTNEIPEKTFATLNGVSAEATSNGIVLNGTALIILENIDASNGMIQAIDAVLLPPTGGEEGGGGLRVTGFAVRNPMKGVGAMSSAILGRLLRRGAHFLC